MKIHSEGATNFLRIRWRGVVAVLLLLCLTVGAAMPVMADVIHIRPSATGLWEIDGTETQLITADDLDIQNQSILNVLDIDGRDISADGTKLDGIETGADVTDADNVDAAGATMNTDTDISGNSWVLDEDDMASDDDTKVSTQQSVKAYADALTNRVYAITPTNVYTANPAVSDSPRQSAIQVVIGDTITLAANDAYRFFHANMEGVSYLKIANISKSPTEYAWVKAKPANNQLQVTDWADVSGWAWSEIISTQKDDVDTDQIELDLSLIIPEGAIGIFTSIAVRESGTPALGDGRLRMSPEGDSGTWVGVNTLVTDLNSNGFPFVPVDSNRHLIMKHEAIGADTLRIWLTVSGYVK